MRIAKDCLVDRVEAVLLSVGSAKPKRRLRNAIDLSHKVPALVVKKILAVGDQELQIADLW